MRKKLLTNGNVFKRTDGRWGEKVSGGHGNVTKLRKAGTRRNASPSFL